MQETCCETSIIDLFKKVFEDGDIGALMQISKKVDILSAADDRLDGLDGILLYYLYYVWMDKNVRKDFMSIKKYILKDLSEIFDFMLQSENFIDNKVLCGENDIYISVLGDIAKDILFRYTGGQVGKSRNNIFIYSPLSKIFNLSYASIPDIVLKTLFIGYGLYGEDLFSSRLEFDYFESFIFDKFRLIYNTNPINDLEDELLNINFV